MITKNDCLSILVKLGDAGVNVTSYVRKLAISPEVPLDVLKFISDNRGMEVSNFYEMLRKKHNQNKSPLYTNIMREIESIPNVITTLSCLLVQINLYANKLQSSDLFLREVRVEEISRVLHEYYLSGSADNCVTMLKLIKSDILVLEYIAGRREIINK